MDLSLISQEKSIFVPIIPHGISPPRQAFQPILIQIVSRPGSGAYLKSLWQRCHSLYRFGVQSRRSRFLRKYHYHLQIIALGNAGSRLAHCLIAISPDSKDAYDPIGGGCDLLVWIVMATSCFGSQQMFCLRYCLFNCQGTFEDRISPLFYIVFGGNNRKELFYSFQERNCIFSLLSTSRYLNVFVKVDSHESEINI